MSTSSHWYPVSLTRVQVFLVLKSAGFLHHFHLYPPAFCTVYRARRVDAYSETAVQCLAYARCYTSGPIGIIMGPLRHSSSALTDEMTDEKGN